jgi:hypothetical protein
VEAEVEEGERHVEVEGEGRMPVRRRSGKGRRKKGRRQGKGRMEGSRRRRREGRKQRRMTN